MNSSRGKIFYLQEIHLKSFFHQTRLTKKILQIICPYLCQIAACNRTAANRKIPVSNVIVCVPTLPPPPRDIYHNFGTNLISVWWELAIALAEQKGVIMTTAVTLVTLSLGGGLGMRNVLKGTLKILNLKQIINIWQPELGIGVGMVKYKEYV